jgi:hypothetical protein
MVEHDPTLDDITEDVADATEERRQEDRRLEDDPGNGHLLDGPEDDEPDLRT